MKRYELRVKSGIVDMSHYSHKYLNYYDTDGFCIEMESSDDRDFIENIFDKENENRLACYIDKNIVYFVLFAVYDNKTKDIIMQTAMDFEDIKKIKKDVDIRKSINYNIPYVIDYIKKGIHYEQ